MTCSHGSATFCHWRLGPAECGLPINVRCPESEPVDDQAQDEVRLHRLRERKESEERYQNKTQSKGRVRSESGGLKDGGNQ